MRENPTPLPRPPNQDLLRHEALRKIEGQVYDLKKKLEHDGIDQDKVQKKLDERRKELVAKMEADESDQYRSFRNR